MAGIEGWDAYLLRLNPIPWTVQVGIGRRKGGGVYPQVYKSDELKTYQEAVKEAIVTPIILEGEIDLVFLFWRQMPDYETHQGKRARKHQADATNMQKALEDALQGVLFANDRDVRSVESHIIEQGHDTDPLVVILIRSHVPTLWETVDWLSIAPPPINFAPKAPPYEGDLF